MTLITDIPLRQFLCPWGGIHVECASRRNRNNFEESIFRKGLDIHLVLVK